MGEKPGTFLRQRVMSAIAPRVAARQATQRQIRTRRSAVPLQSLQSIYRASRLEATGRAQPRTKQQAVAAHQANQRSLHHADVVALVTARSNSCSSSDRTACLSWSEVALMNTLRSNPPRRRTTWAACGKRGSKAWTTW